MYPADFAFISQIKDAAAANERLIAQMIRGEIVFDGRCLADARRRLLDARLILAAYA